MFSKPHHPAPPHSPPFARAFPAADDTSPTAGPSPALLSGDGATIEVVRRPRGRPPGSRNKPKPPVIITRETEPAMTPYILEVPGGGDVVEAIGRFCCRRNTGLCLLTGYGTVVDVTLRQPPAAAGATVTIPGRFDILSVRATFLPHTASFPIPNGFSITLAGPHGQIFGGMVAGALVAAGPVYVIAASFNNPSYQRLPWPEEVGGSGSGDGEEGQSPSVSGGKDSEGQVAGDSCGLPLYSSRDSAAVIWAPTARQPPPPHQPY